MADLLNLKIITQRSVLLETETPWVTLPGEMGELGVLPQHVPLVSTLNTGVLQFENGEGVQKVAVHYGYAQVRGDKITVLLDMAEIGRNIDLERARQAERRARDELQRSSGDQDAEAERHRKHEAKLLRAIMRQSAGQ